MIEFSYLTSNIVCIYNTCFFACFPPFVLQTLSFVSCLMRTCFLCFCMFHFTQMLLFYCFICFCILLLIIIIVIAS
jgi:hypothetical protein